jgi:D-alanyl-D-alanine carboxypeptidase (penicillin-binding protein 5/6)
VPRGRLGEIEATLLVPDHIVAPIAAGSRVGSVRVSLGDERLAEADVTVAEDVPEGGWLRRGWHWLKLKIAGD